MDGYLLTHLVVFITAKLPTLEVGVESKQMQALSVIIVSIANLKPVLFLAGI
jgi:hypothetical protein